MNHNATQPKRLWLLYFPRSAHHLFKRMFSGQQDLEMIEALGSFSDAIIPTVQLSARTSLDEAMDECDELHGILQRGYKAWSSQIEGLETTGKRVLNSSSIPFQISPAIHRQCLDHWRGEDSPPKQRPASSPFGSAYWQVGDGPTTSPTMFPDEFLRSHIPILLIRHPALTFPSTVRAASGFFETDVGETFMDLVLRFRWHVMVYEWYHKDPVASDPLILDSDDMMYNPAALTELCKRTGLDAAAIRYEWGRQEIDVTYEKEEIFQSVLANSTGVVPGKSSEDVDIEEEFPKWVAEFDRDRAQMIKKLVEDAMPDYLFLRERSIPGRP